MTQPEQDEKRVTGPWVTTVLAALCVLALAGVVTLLLWLSHQTDEREQAEQDQADAIRATQVFTEQWNTFRPQEVDDYLERVQPLLSAKFGKQFEDAAQDVVTGITQQRLFSKGEVLVDGDGVPLVGIASIDPDSAEVLVAADAKRVANQQRVLRHWRWQVSLVKVDGEWLVDDFKEV